LLRLHGAVPKARARLHVAPVLAGLKASSWLLHLHWRAFEYLPSFPMFLVRPLLSATALLRMERLLERIAAAVASNAAVAPECASDCVLCVHPHPAPVRVATGCGDAWEGAGHVVASMFPSLPKHMYNTSGFSSTIASALDAQFLLCSGIGHGGFRPHDQPTTLEPTRSRPQ
jgi:hypothetical protein